MCLCETNGTWHVGLCCRLEPLLNCQNKALHKTLTYLGKGAQAWMYLQILMQIAASVSHKIIAPVQLFTSLPCDFKVQNLLRAAILFGQNSHDFYPLSSDTQLDTPSGFEVLAWPLYHLYVPQYKLLRECCICLHVPVWMVSWQYSNCMPTQHIRFAQHKLQL